MMGARLAISLFGPFDVQVDGEGVILGVAGATRSLLQYLICAGGRLVRREQLLDLLWSDTSLERRRSSLNSAIWRIRKALRAARVPAPFALEASADCVRLAGLSAAGVEVDVIALADVLARATAPDAQEAEVERLVQLLGGCSGDPLDGVDDHWAISERERLRTLRMRSLSAGMRLLAARRRYDESLEFGRRILLDDPFHESALQELLCIHAMNGQRARGLRLFDDFSRSLERELGIVPMAETRALRDYMASSAPVEPALAPQPLQTGAGASVHPCLGQLFGQIEQSRAPLELHS